MAAPKDLGQYTDLNRYCCNQQKAVEELSQAFGISDQSHTSDERDFCEWMETDRAMRGPSNKARRWRPSYDTGRQLSCMAFGIDFGSSISRTQPRTSNPASTPHQRLHGRDHSSPEIRRQRISAYLQRPYEAITPSARLTTFNTGPQKLEPYSRSNTMIIFEHLSDAVSEITEIPHLLGLDVLPTNLTSESKSENIVPVLAMQDTLTHIFTRVRQAWTEQLLVIHEQYTALEDSVYAQPADASQAQQVWTISQHLHDMLKLVLRHAKLVEGVQEDFRSFAEIREDDFDDWLAGVHDEFMQLATDLEADYIKPLENIIDLVSVLSFVLEGLRVHRWKGLPRISMLPGDRPLPRSQVHDNKHLPSHPFLRVLLSLTCPDVQVRPDP